MNQNRNFEVFVKKFKLTINALAESNYRKAHSHSVLALNSFYDYAYELDGLERLRAFRFGKEIKAIEKLLSDKLDSMKSLDDKVKSNDFMAGVSGQEHVKSELMRLVVYPELYPDLYTKFNKRRSGGILLYGVPGTGKTRIAQMLANDLGAKFYEIKCSDVISKWFGESEKNIKDIFEEARKQERAVIFFDEFESLGAVRGSESNSPISRVISELLSQIQGFDDNNNNVFIMAATNRPWDIDTAFMRPGRFSSVIHVDLPNDEARLDIVKFELAGIELEDNFNYNVITDSTIGYSAADMVEFCERLKDRVIYRLINKIGVEAITNDDVEFVLKTLSSSVSPKDIKMIDDYKSGKLVLSTGYNQVDTMVDIK